MKVKRHNTSNSPKGQGDHYGVGVKNKTAKLRDSYVTPKASKKQLGNPPKKLG